MKPGCRAVAAGVLSATINRGQSLADTLPGAIEQVEERDRALLQQLCYGGLRNYYRLDGVLQQLLKKPLKPRDGDINALMLLGLYQILDMRTPDHASISSTVEATRQLKKPWASGLVNGVLRRCSRERETLLQNLKPEQRDNHPRWLLQLLEQSWPDQLQQIIAANNSQPPMCLRVNRRQGQRDDYLAQLEELDIDARPCLYAPDGIWLGKPMDVRQLPGFDAGRVSVQDEAAQLAAPMLGAQAGDRVLDACAAPGGKTCHILELEPGLEQLLATDIDSSRLQKVEENLQRLQLKAEVMQVDASKPQQDIGSMRFDRILIDAPCSGSGVIRRHPDIKLLRRASDLDGFAETQLSILRSLWPLLRPGGRLLYVTCSIFPTENQDLLARFLAETENAREHALPVSWGHACSHGRQILPDTQGSDGLYYAALHKAP